MTMNMTAKDVITMYEAVGDNAPIKKTLGGLIMAPTRGKVIATTDLKTVKAKPLGTAIEMTWDEYRELIKYYYNHDILYWGVEDFHDEENMRGDTPESGIAEAMSDLLEGSGAIDRSVTLIGHVPNDPNSRVATSEVEGLVRSVVEGFFESISDERTDDYDYALKDIDEGEVYQEILPAFQRALKKYRPYYTFEVVKYEIPDTIKWCREHMEETLDGWIEEEGSVRENDGSVTDLQEQPEQ